MSYGLEDEIYDRMRELYKLLKQADSDGREPVFIIINDKVTIQLRNPLWWTDGEEIYKSLKSIIAEGQGE